MPHISISAEGIKKLLEGLNLDKAAEPDKFKPIILPKLHNELGRKGICKRSRGYEEVGKWDGWVWSGRLIGREWHWGGRVRGGDGCEGKK